MADLQEVTAEDGMQGATVERMPLHDTLFGLFQEPDGHLAGGGLTRIF
jgi:hypothetical protein